MVLIIGVHAFSGFDMRSPDSVTEGSTSTTPTEQGGGGVGGGLVGVWVCWFVGGRGGPKPKNRFP